MMSHRAWWTGIALIVLAVVFHAALPRYEWHTVAGQSSVLVRVDRWTGRAQWGAIDRATAEWRPIVDPTLKVWADVDQALREK